ncbi:MAG: PAS domain S-box protein [Acidobacteriia bacterium]|nr:PAS domain S-box protein [Terriglobia bacterium]
MNMFPVPFKTVAMTLLTLVVVTVGILNLRDRASWIDATDGAFWVESESGLRAAEVAPDGPAAAAGIKQGDLLISLNGKAVANLGEYSDELYRVGPHGSLLYGLLSGSDTREVGLQLAGRSFLQPKDGLRTTLAFLYLGIGIFVMIRGSNLSRAFHFYLLCLTAFVLCLYSFTPRWGAFDQSIYALSVSAWLLLPALFIHFCLRFPIDPKPAHTRAPLLYAPMIALGVLQALWMTGHLADAGLPLDARSLGILDRVHLVYLCAGLLIGGIILLRRKMAARDLTTGQQMKWVSYGTLAGTVPFVLIYGLPSLFAVRASFPMLASQLFLGLIPLSFAYAILHYRLLDVEAIVRRSAAYLVASSLLLALYLVFVLVLGRWLQSIVPDADFVIICIAVLAIAMMFAPLRNSIQARLDRIFYKEQFDDRASLLDFARTLSTEMSLPRLSRRILERIAKTFQIDKVVLFLADPVNPGRYRVADALGLYVPMAETWLLEEADLGGADRPPSVSDQAQGVNHLHRAHPALTSKGLHFLQDLRLRGRRIGVIGLGQLARNQHFSTEDLDLLDALSGYASIALENANLYRSIETKALELERLKIYTENIIESINIAVLALDLKGTITSCNRAFEELYKIGRNRIAGSSVENLLGKDVVASIQRVTGTSGWNVKSAGNIFKLYLQTHKGQKLIVNMSIIPLLDAMDLNSGCLIVMDDITDKMRLEDQLLQAEKLSSIGLLAAGIAHEVNTPITGISSYAQMLLKETPADDVRKPILEKIEKQTFRAAEIVNGLLNFARMNGSEYTDLDLNQLIGESLSLLEHQFRQNHVEITYSPDQSIPRVYGNAGKLQQVFVNLFLNARDAMPSGGSLKVETSKNDTMVVVDIRDSGAGISAENIRKIYDPFFTTKSTGKGTGLGLAVTYGIIQEHGGRIFVDSAPAKGTHFRLKLPTRQSLQE